MFQLPAIYLAEKYNLLTLVITPLIGLMSDQVQNLEERGYTGAKTINSDIIRLTGEKKKNAKLALGSFLKVKIVSGSTVS